MIINLLYILKKALPHQITAFIYDAIVAQRADLLLAIFNQYERDRSFAFLTKADRDNIVNFVIKDSLSGPKDKLALINKLQTVGIVFPSDIDEIKKQLAKSIRVLSTIARFVVDNEWKNLSDFLGRSPQIDFNGQIDDGRTLLDFAYTQRSSEMSYGKEEAKLSESHGLAVQPDAAEELKKQQGCVADEEEKNQSTLLSAKREAFFLTVLEKSNIFAKTTNNQSILHLVTARQEEAPLLDIVHFLLKGADPSAIDLYNHNPFFYLKNKEGSLYEGMQNHRDMLEGCVLLLIALEKGEEYSGIDKARLSEAETYKTPILIKKYSGEFFLYGDKADNGEWKFTSIPHHNSLASLSFSQDKIDRSSAEFSTSLVDALKIGHPRLEQGIEYYLRLENREKLWTILIEDNRRLFPSGISDDDDQLLEKIKKLLEPLLEAYLLIKDINGNTLFHRCLLKKENEKALALIASGIELASKVSHASDVKHTSEMVPVSEVEPASEAQVLSELKYPSEIKHAPELKQDPALISSVIDIQNNEGNTALHLAVLQCNPEGIKTASALVKMGAKTNILNRQRETPFDISCRLRDSAMTAALLETTDDLSLPNIEKVFSLAVLDHDVDILAILIKKHLNALTDNDKINEIINKEVLYVRDYYPLAVTRLLIENDILKLDKNESIKILPLFKCAVEEMDTALIKMLLEKECVDIVDIKKAIFNKKVLKNPDALRMLLESCQPSDLDDDMKWSLLWEACKYGSPAESVGMLIKGVKLNRQNQEGETVLHLAVRRLRAGIVQELLENGADPNIKNKNGFSPLHLATRNGPDWSGAASHIINQLLLKGADPLLDSTYRISRFVPYWDSTPLDFVIRHRKKYSDTGFEANDARSRLGWFNVLLGILDPYFHAVRLRWNKNKYHLDYLLRKNDITNTDLESLPYSLKKPYPGLLNELIKRAVITKNAQCLSNIFDNYTNEQLAFLGKDKALIQKIVLCLNDSVLAPQRRVAIIDKLNELSPSTMKQIEPIITPITSSMQVMRKLLEEDAKQGVATADVKEEKSMPTIAHSQSVFSKNTNMYLQMMQAVIKYKQPKQVARIINENSDQNLNIKTIEGRNLLDIVYTRNRLFEMKNEEKKSVLESLSDHEEYKASKEIFSLLLMKLNINDRTKGNKTLLHVAIENNAPISDFVLFLLMGADPRLQDAEGREPVTYMLEPDRRPRESMRMHYDFMQNMGDLLLPKNKETLEIIAKEIDANVLQQMYDQLSNDDPWGSSLRDQVITKLWEVRRQNNPTFELR